MNQSRHLDQFYTRPDVARMCVDELKRAVPIRHVIEPSAGTGAFSSLFKDCTALDLDPKLPNIKQTDFFDFMFVGSPSEVAVVGNPPYGKNSSLAIKFFNHAAAMADCVAFVLPLTFRKESTQSKLNPAFHLVRDVDLPKFSFLFNNTPYDVPSCFQVWLRRSDNRPKPHKAPQIVELSQDANLVVRRVGGRAGFPIDKDTAAKASSLFLKAPQEVVNFMNSPEYTPPLCVNHTAGMRSITVNELNKHLERLGFTK